MNFLDINLLGKINEDSDFIVKNVELINYHLIFIKKNIRIIRYINEKIIKRYPHLSFPYYAIALLYKDFKIEYELAEEQLNCFDFYVAMNCYRKAISIDSELRKESLDKFFHPDNFLNEKYFESPEILDGDLANYYLRILEREGTKYFKEKKYYKSSEYFSHYLKINPISKHINYYTGLSKYYSGKLEESLQYFNQLQSLESNSQKSTYHSNYWIGLIYYGLAKYTDSIRYFSIYIKSDPFNSNSFELRGKSKMELKDYLGAIYDFDQVLKYEPNNGEIHFCRGECHINLKQKKKGLIDLSKAGELGYEKAYEIISEYSNRKSGKDK